MYQFFRPEVSLLKDGTPVIECEDFFSLKVVFLKREIPRYRIILHACVHHQESIEFIFLPIYTPQNN